MKAPLVLLVACLLLFFTGLGDVPFYTRGEPREALVAREMLRTGEWLVPARPDGELTRKPPALLLGRRDGARAAAGASGAGGAPAVGAPRHRGRARHLGGRARDASAPRAALPAPR